MKPLAIDLFCGLGGWTKGLLAAGYRVVGFDITRHVYGEKRYPAQLVLHDVLTIHGSQFKDATLIVVRHPARTTPTWRCRGVAASRFDAAVLVREGIPWSGCPRCNGTGFVDNSRKAKELRRKWETEGPDNRLFDACFRIQREAIDAAGRYIPLVVENVRGAQEWVGRAKANYGSFYLWGDVDMVGNRIIANGQQLRVPRKVAEKVPGFRFDGSGRSFQSASVAQTGVKVESLDGGRRTDVGKGARFTSRDCGVEAGTKIGGDWFRDPACYSKHGSRSNARKAASAMIAEIPFPLGEFVGMSFHAGGIS